MSQRILYIDDDDDLIDLARRMLSAAGYEVAGFVKGDDGLAALRADPTGFDLVVTDYNMPGLSGLELVGMLRAVRPDVRILIMSGHVGPDLRRRAAEAGVDHVLEKPGTIRGICDAIRQVLPAAD